MLFDTLAPVISAVPSKVTVYNDDTVTPGLMGSGVVLLLGIAVFFLLRSFRKHVNRVPATFDDPTDTASSDPADKVEH